MQLSERRGSRAAVVVFWATAAFVLVMALLPHPPQVPGHPSDKIQHMAAFLTLGLLGSSAYPAARATRLIILLSLFGAFIEVAQAIPILHRDSDPLDWLADTVACAVAAYGVLWWRARRRLR